MKEHASKAMFIAVSSTSIEEKKKMISHIHLSLLSGKCFGDISNQIQSLCLPAREKLPIEWSNSVQIINTLTLGYSREKTPFCN